MTAPDAVLIIGGGMLQVPCIQAAHALGLQVIATDADPRAPGALEADLFCQVDTYDALATAALLPALQEAFTVRGVVCCGNDVAPTVSLCAARAGALGIPYRVACQTHDKALVRGCLDAAGLARYQPRWQLGAGDWPPPLRIEAITRGILGGWPVVVKPLEERASRGVSIVHTPADFPVAVTQVLAYGETYLLEECLVGTEHSAELILEHGAVRWWNVVDRSFDYTSGTGIEVGHTNPSQLPSADLAAMQQMALLAAQALDVTWGPFKVDCMQTITGPKILECTARLSGGWDSQWTSPATGRHPMRILLQLACGLPVDVPAPSHGAAACAAILPQHAGRLTALPPRVPGVDVVWAVAPGDTLTPATHNGMRAGYVLAHAATTEDAWRTARNTAEALRAIVDHQIEGLHDAKISN